MMAGISIDAFRVLGSIRRALFRPPGRGVCPLAPASRRARVLALTLAGLSAGATAQTGISWRQASATGPGKRDACAMAYDSTHGKVILFGGIFEGYILGDTWAWDGSAWSQVSNTGPSPRFGATMAYDSTRGRVVLFGGRIDDYWASYIGDTWEWDGTTWRRVATIGPSARSTSMAYDSNRGRTVLFGGFYVDWASGSSPITYGDTWEWSGTKWYSRASTGPAPRSGAGMAYDSARGRALLFGGWGATTGFADTWEWEGATWTQVATTGPSPRESCGMAYDSARNRTVVFGGWGVGAYCGDTWEWDATSWTQVATTGPNPRDVSMVYDSARGQTVLYGGFGDTGFFADTWLYGPLSVPPPFTLADAGHAIRGAAGLAALSDADRARCDVESTGASAGCIDMLDALRIARKVAGLEANP